MNVVVKRNWLYNKIYHLSFYFIEQILFAEYIQGILCTVIVQVKRIENVPGRKKSQNYFVEIFPGLSSYSLLLEMNAFDSYWN